MFLRSAGLLLVVVSLPVMAAPIQRLQVTQRGGFLLVGNTLAHDCAPGVPAPVVGSVGACGTNTSDSAPDVFWRADSPTPGTAEASTTITAPTARSSAVVTLSSTATVTHAFLYWSAASSNGMADNTVTLDRPGVFSTSVVAEGMNSAALNGLQYVAVSDVTAAVQAHGPGPYRVSGVDAAALAGVNNATVAAGWWLVVVYDDPSLPTTSITVFDGADVVLDGQPATALVTGVDVPPTATPMLGIVTLDGDNASMGDTLSVNGMPLSDPLNPASNVFNGTRSRLGMATSVAGDLPQLTGGPASMSGLDLDVLGVGAGVVTTDATLSAATTADTFVLTTLVFATETRTPDFRTSTKTVADLNGGALLAGDVVEYTITAVNSGDQTSSQTSLRDALPAGVSYVPGSLRITSGPNAGAHTDSAGDDLCEYDFVTRTIVCRLGTGANAISGGALGSGASTTVTFRVMVNPGTTGSVSNQAFITAQSTQAPTDGDPNTDGAQPTTFSVDACASNADCVAPTPYCDTAAAPNACVACLVDTQCPPTTPTCEPMSRTCVCVPQGQETCNARDDDCNGAIDEGFNLGAMCTAGVGACQASGVVACDGQGSATCTAMPGAPMTETCGDSVDDDCNGVPDNGCEDSDDDGLLDSVEIAQALNPLDADSDDDGVPDGEEPAPLEDTDGDGRINALDWDSDEDGLFDGTELGRDCALAATDGTAMHCTADADPATTTDPLVQDSDMGGLGDGREDTDHDGAVDPGERNPRDASDDTAECFVDAECGPALSGRICTARACVDGCRGQGGNGCPAGLVCSSTTADPGTCAMAMDASIPVEDAGIEPDASTEAPDASTEAPDAAMEAPDASTEARDASMTADAGTRDAAVMLADAGGAQAIDAGNASQDDDGGGQDCACDAAGGSAPMPDVLVGALVLLLASRRRVRTGP